ncbi:MAG: tetratricopeptide repeat protein [Chloroflexota bacterium]|nr:tetratricopeptide repeat protein [Chloroflexota bacterium]
MAEKLALTLLGHPELHLAGQPLAKFRSAKAYALLYYLAVSRRTQPRTVLAGLFWGDVGDYYARRNLNRTLSNLTQLVGDHLEIARQSLAFARSQPYWLDVEALEAAATMLPTGQNVAALAAAADGYRGDFLAGFYVQDAPEFEQWVLTERTRLRTCIVQLLHTLSQYHAEQGDLMPAMDYARRILQLEPWREEAHRQLMLLLAQSGQRSAALAQYELCRQALKGELDVEPDAATLELVARIRAGEFAPPSPAKPTLQSAPLAPAPTHNLPSQRTPFIGRAAELADITRLLVEDDDCRLLTLVGPGGMGKTRLALKAAEGIVASPALQQCFGDGVFFVPLENVGDANGLVSAVISAISEKSGLRLRIDAPLQEQLLHLLRAKAMLLVLDNFEHLVKYADLCSTLLAAAPRVKLLVTARETLGLQEAWFYPVLGLTLPNDLPERKAQQGEYDAVRLFAQCARRTLPSFALEGERAAVLRLCTLVEGMPLGIELAAAWLKVMSCEQIAQEITRGLDFLTARYQNIPLRHRSMRAVMEHSWALLAADEGEAIARLSIFRGRFSHEAAGAITGASLFTLATLVEKALVRVTPDSQCQLHELTRQYAEEQLTSAARSALRDAHAIYYAGLLDQQRARLFTSAYRQVWATVGGELDNIRHAWQWIIDAVGTGRDDLSATSLLRQMAEVLTCYYLFHSLWLPGQALFDHACQVLEAAGWASSSDRTAGQPSRRATLLHLQISAGQFQMEMGHHRASLMLAERTLAACREFGVEDDLFRALMIYGITQVRRGARAEAVPALQEALALGERLRLPRYCAEALIGLGLVASSEGRYADAQGYYRQELALCQEIGYRPWIARTLTNLGTTYARQHDYQQARPYYEQALAIAQEEGDQNNLMINTSNLGGVHRGFGRHQLSIDYYQRSLAMARNLGDERWIAANLNGLSITYLAMDELAAAERALREALAVGLQSDSTPDTLGSIGLLGHLFARRGQLERALKALAFVEQHPATMARDRLYNEPILAELRSELAPALFEQAAAWATDQALDGVVRWLLYGEGAFPVVA